MKWARTISSSRSLTMTSGVGTDSAPRQRAAVRTAQRSCSAASQVEDHVAPRLGAADEHAPVGGWLHRVGAVTDTAGDERRLTGLADAGSARPPDWYVARLGEFQQAAVGVTPRDREVAAGECDRGAASGLVDRRVGRPCRRCRYARRLTRSSPERLGVDVERENPQARQAGADVVHERRRPAQVRLRVEGRFELGNNRPGETARAVEAPARHVIRIGAAVVKAAARVRERVQKGSGLGSKWMLAAVACAVQPPDGSIGVLLHQCVEHGEHGCGPDPGAHQQYWCARPVQDERSARGRDVEPVADGQTCAQIPAHRAAELTLDTDPVVVCPRRSGHRVVPQQRLLPLIGPDSHRKALACAGGRQRSAVRVLETYRDHRVALVGDRRGRQRPKAEPGGRRAGGREAGVAASGLLIEQSSERGLPPRTESGNPERSEQFLSPVPGEVQQPVDFGDRHLLGSRSQLDDLVSRLHLTFVKYTEVEPGAAVGDEESGNPLIVHADAYAVAGHPRLGHLERRRADPIAVADAHLVVGESFYGEVLAELSVDEVVAPQLALPVPVRVDLVDEHGTLFTAMPGQIALTVAVEVELADPSTTGDGLLEHAGDDGSPLPRHLFRRSDVDREQPPDPLSSGLGRLHALRPRAQAHRATVAGIEATDRCAKTAVRLQADGEAVSPTALESAERGPRPLPRRGLDLRVTLRPVRRRRRRRPGSGPAPRDPSRPAGAGDRSGCRRRPPGSWGPGPAPSPATRGARWWCRRSRRRAASPPPRGWTAAACPACG